MKIKIEKDFARPWGGFIKFIDNKPCTVKIHYLKKGEAFSLQSHKLRREFWYVVSGKMKVFIGKDAKKLKTRILSEGEHIFVPKNAIHRAEGLAAPVSKFLEICLGKFKEDDITRYEDKYGRV